MTDFIRFFNVVVGGALALLTACYIAPWFYFYGPLTWWQFAAIEAVAIAIAAGVIAHIDRTEGRL